MISPSDLADVPLFQALSQAHVARIAAHAADISANAGEWIIFDRDPAYFWVMLSGEVEVIKTVAGESTQATTFEAGEYFGEVPLMLNTTALGSVRALQPSRLARIDPTDFHAIVTESEAAGAMLAQTLVRRVQFIKNAYAASTFTQATIVGDRFDFACHDVRDFLSRNQIIFEWLNPADPADIPCIPAAVLENKRFPAVLLSDGTVLSEPKLRELARCLRLDVEPQATEYDVIIIGGGPAGLAAAVYGGSEGLHTMMIEREAPGGQAGTSSRIENYLGFPGGVSGGELASRALSQAKRFGTEILVTRSVLAISSDNGVHTVQLDGGMSVRAKAIVVATGVAWKRLEAFGADQFIGRGVYYGAARTEALGTTGKDIFLIGGGNSAGQAAMFFANYAISVTILVRGVSLERTMSHYLIEQLRTKRNIFVETETTVCAVGGALHLETLTTQHAHEKEPITRRADGIFAFIGALAETSWLPAAVNRDDRGYILTGHEVLDRHRERPPFPLETSVPGIFAAGDVRSNSVKRVASGVGEGSMVISFIHQYLASPETQVAAVLPRLRG